MPVKALPHYQWWARCSEPTAPMALLSGISLSYVWTPLAPAELGHRRARGQCGLQTCASSISPSPQLVTCLPLSSFFLHLLHSFSFPHSRFLLFFNKLFLFFFFFVCFFALCFLTYFFPHIPCPCHTNLPRFTLFLSTSYYFVAYFKAFFSPQPCSSSLSCYILAYFSLVLCSFSHLPFHPCCSFKKFQLCVAPFLGPARSVPPLLLIAKDDALKTLFSTFIIITSLLSSLLEFTSGLRATQLPNFISFIGGRTASTGTSVAMYIHSSTLQPYLAPNDRSSR